MKQKTSMCACIVAVALFSLAAYAQLIIDATGPHKSPWEGAHAGSGGGTGRKAPLQISLVLKSRVPRSDGRIVVEFTLSNSGTAVIELPVSPEGEQVDGADTFRSLSLSVWKQGEMPEPQRRVPGSAILYGSERSGTLVKLAPGETIRILGEVALPPDPGPNEKGPTLVAMASIDDMRVTTVDGKPFLESKEVGYAVSPSYTLQALYNSAN
jgi:hypothetical protein